MSGSKYTASVVLITGGGSGIGAGLASTFHQRGARVVIAGRTRERLEAVASKHPGMEIEVVDVADPIQVAALAGRIGARHPSLDTLINNAGVQTLVDFAALEPHDPLALGAEVDVNLKGLLYVTNAFLPLLRQQGAARLINVGSGLGFVPLAAAPIYSATKAAVHSFTVSLRRQLARTSVEVVEIIPPVVETDLHRGLARRPPRAMPLDAFVTAAMAGLDAGRPEIAVGLANVLRIGSRVSPALFLNIVNKGDQ
ncbi:SDR family oxidoreductase [Methylobacterium iners]|uniref:3-phenylpropionate-dihydrodiol/cinnamic acid-dihydrodiol dehydrogenase n=1 Tax=Methylobacterium iners TaxID=418707 RepID=A0ABQ4RV70_9HYPH|nr:SDR family NAD(P)-dependent oxidoreductase [Methylobacterium iners]GJD93599.1 3-phenylpropionate-dihydrodiol/cinnamic acid-dihydrodiol dehydrogenase [Methylobacterium iners]